MRTDEHWKSLGPHSYFRSKQHTTESRNGLDAPEHLLDDAIAQTQAEPVISLRLIVSPKPLFALF